MMEIEFSYNEEEVRNNFDAPSASPLGSRMRGIVVLFLMGFIALVVLVFQPLIEGNYDEILRFSRENVVPLLLLFVIAIPLFLVLNWKDRYRTRPIDPNLLKPMTIRLDPEGLHIKNIVGNTTIKWPTFKSVEETEKYIRLKITSQSFLAVPKRALVAASRAEDFLRSALTLWSGSESTYDGKAPMDVATTFRSTRYDHFILVLFVFTRVYWKWIVGLIFVPPLFIFLREVLFGAALQFALVKAGAIFSLMLLVNFLAVLMLTFRDEPDSDEFSEARLSLTQSGFLAQTRSKGTWYLWRDVGDLRQDGSQIYFILNKKSVLGIPKRDFVSKTESDKFFEAARARWHTPA